MSQKQPLSGGWDCPTDGRAKSSANPLPPPKTMTLKNIVKTNHFRTLIISQRQATSGKEFLLGKLLTGR